MKTEDLAREVLSKLTDEGRTLATAESCTGGLLGKLLTDIPGASNAYKGGVISYSSSRAWPPETRSLPFTASAPKS